jgi:hypothetical protein
LRPGHDALKRQQLAAIKGQPLHLPAVRAHRVRGGAEDVVDVNPFAVIAAVVLSETIHPRTPHRPTGDQSSFAWRFND